LVSTATPVKGGYLLNGSKRWIGNASHSDIMIVFARDTSTRKVKGFIVDSHSSGITTTVIKRKLALRPIQNCDIYFKDVFVSDENKLLGPDGFTEGVNRVLNSSRMFVPWVSIGMMGGVYETSIKYAKNRIQFQVPISSFQLIQEKLVRMLGYFNASFLQGWRIMTLEKCEVSQSAAVKSQVTMIGREVTKLAREVLGGNGILIENYVMKAMLDMEAIYSYEGTYEINVLAAGRAITGIPAFKSSFKL
jgi:acyl-CoA oxidase